MVGTNVRKRGRPPTTAAVSHKAVIDAVYDLLSEGSVRDLTMERVAKHAGVGKPTLYKWWSSKAALVMATFAERIDQSTEPSSVPGGEAGVRKRVKALVSAFNGLFGKVMAELIAEGQSDPEIIRELYDSHMSRRRAATIADLRRAIIDGELIPETDPELLVDEIFGALYYRLLLKTGPLTKRYGDKLVDHAFRGYRLRNVRS